MLFYFLSKYKIFMRISSCGHIYNCYIHFAYFAYNVNFVDIMARGMKYPQLHKDCS